MSKDSVKQKIFWIAQIVDDRHRSRAQLLERFGYEVFFIKTVKNFETKVLEQKVGIFLISDNGSPKIILDIVRRFLLSPFVSGARILLFLDKNHHELCEFVAANCFRDILSADLSDEEFIYRVRYSSANKAIDYPAQTWEYEFSEQRPVMYLPIRLIWISDKLLRIECSFSPPVGGELNLAGDFIRHLDLKFLKVKVLKKAQIGMRFRFKNALICSYDSQASFLDSSHTTLEGLQFIDAGRQIRVFAAVSSLKLRNSIAEKLQGERILLSFAIRVKNIADDPGYIKPDIVLIEADFARDKYLTSFIALANSIDENSAIIVLGLLTEKEEESIQKKCKGRKIFVRSSIPYNFEEVIFSDYLNREDIIKSANSVNFLTDDPFSYAYTKIKVDMVSLHSQIVKLKSSVEFAEFSLFKLESKLFDSIAKDGVWLKVVRNRALDNYLFECHALILNFDSNQKERYFSWLASKMNLKKHDPRRDDISFTLPKEDSEKVAYVEIEAAADVAKKKWELTKDYSKSQAIRMWHSRRLRIYLLYVFSLTMTIYVFAKVFPKIAERFKETGGVYGIQILEYSGMRSKDDGTSPAIEDE